MHIFIQCPHCETTTRKEVELWELSSLTPKIFFCYPKDGGCDRYFAASFKTDVKVTTYTLNG